MTPKSSLSLCIITLNDEKYITDCLIDNKEICDEIIIADLGSSDNTVRLAEQYGASVLRVDYDNDLSKVKNLCMDKAGGRWVLFLYPDEIVSPKDFGSLTQLLDNPNSEAYLMYIDNGIEHNKIISPVQGMRLIRNRASYRFRHRSFEHIPDEHISNVNHSGIVILKKPRLKINPLDTLMDELTEVPEDCYLLYICGLEMLNLEKLQESLSFFQNAHRYVNPEYLYAPHLFKCLSFVCISLGMHIQAYRYLDEGIKYFPLYTDLLVLRAELETRDKRYKEAILDMETALKALDQPNFAAVKPEIPSAVMLEILGDIHELVFNFQQALLSYGQAFSLNHRNHALLYKIGGLCGRIGSTELLEKLLDEINPETDFESLMPIMDILFKNGRYSAVLECTDVLELLLGKSEQFQSIRIACYLMLGEKENAARLISEISVESPFYSNVLLMQIDSCWIDGNFNKAAGLLALLDEQESVKAEVKALYHGMHIILFENTANFIQITSSEHELVKAVVRKFIHSGQKEKAQLLLPVLMYAVEYYEIIQLSILCNGFEALEEFLKQKTTEDTFNIMLSDAVEQLLRRDSTEAAERIAQLKTSNLPEQLKIMLNCKSFIRKLHDIMELMDGKDIIQQSHIKNAELAPEALSSLYQSINTYYSEKPDIPVNASKVKTSAEIHCSIGKLFESNARKRNALFSYMNALEEEPLNLYAQGKAVKLYTELLPDFDVFKSEISVQGTYFTSANGVENYIKGLASMKTGDTNKAAEYFSKIEEHTDIRPIALGYTLSCLWIECGENNIPEKAFNNNLISFTFFQACCCHAMNILEDGCRIFPYSELILKENQKLAGIYLSKCQ